MVSKELPCNTQLRTGTAIQRKKLCKHTRRLSNLFSSPCQKAFPIAYWCRLLPQTDLSVNIVRPSHQNPLLSTWTAMEGELHFDTTPIAPPGSEMLMHQKPARRSSFGLNVKRRGTWGHASSTTERFEASFRPRAGRECRIQ